MTPTTLALLSAIKVAKTRLNLVCVVKRSSVVLNVIKVLRKHNLVYGAVRGSEWKTLVYLRYFRGKVVLNNISTLSKSSRRLHVTGRYVESMARYHPALIFLFSNSFGVTSHTGRSMPMLAKQVTSGELFAVIW